MVTSPVFGSRVGFLPGVFGLVTVNVTFPPTPTVGVTVPPILSLFKIFGIVRVTVLGVTVIGSGVTVIVGVPTLISAVAVLQLLLGLSVSHSL